MQSFSDPAREEARLWQEMNAHLHALAARCTRPFASPHAAVALLEEIRHTAYENLNQIQHEYLAIRAVAWLLAEKICPPQTQWEWNPRQTGTASEPDLRGSLSGVVILSAEVTASARPIGAIDQRMRHTLCKLSAAPGTQFYFVRTTAMLQRATTKIKKAGWRSITPVCLG